MYFFLQISKKLLIKTIKKKELLCNFYSTSLCYVSFGLNGYSFDTWVNCIDNKGLFSFFILFNLVLTKLQDTFYRF